MLLAGVEPLEEAVDVVEDDEDHGEENESDEGGEGNSVGEGYSHWFEELGLHVSF